ncbi:MAG: hypothetical protein IT557_11330 [Alphaproteobacteria bacterium]|nr:hypothetical protein [Alphaproteobacteria bacterium]
MTQFLARQSAFVAQKTVYDYCEVKTGRDWEFVRDEPAFRDVMEICRWRVYFATLGDVTAMIEAWLRPAALALPEADRAPGTTADAEHSRRERLAQALAALHNRVLAGEAPPAELAPHAADAAQGILGRLARMQLAAPHKPHELPTQAEPTLYETLPIHPSRRTDDGPAIVGALRFNLVVVHDRMAATFDRAGLAASLLARPPDGASAGTAATESAP